MRCMYSFAQGFGHFILSLNIVIQLFEIYLGVLMAVDFPINSDYSRDRAIYSYPDCFVIGDLPVAYYLFPRNPSLFFKLRTAPEIPVKVEGTAESSNTF